jgi:hypothetical protein
MEEDKLSKAIDLLISEVKIYDQYYCLATSQALKTVLNELDRLQKENEQLHKFILEGITIENSPFQNYQLDILRENFIPIWRIKNLIKELKQDDINMTRKYKEKKNITGELLGIDKVRVRAYREKTREINEKLHKILIETTETKGEK